jgi:hypothetical protein
MKPKIAYLIDENVGWDMNPDWKFYSEEEFSNKSLQPRSKNSCKRIVYWEIEEDG